MHDELAGPVSYYENRRFIIDGEGPDRAAFRKGHSPLYLGAATQLRQDLNAAARLRIDDR